LTAVFDLEGTLTAGETWKAVGRYLKAHGKKAAYDRFFARHLPGALLVKARLLPKRWYQNLWMEHLARLFAGMDAAELRHLAEAVVEEELWPRQKEEVLKRLQSLYNAGHRVVIASGSYQPVVEAFARKIGPGVEALGTPLEFKGGRATGRLAGPMNVGKVKAERVLELLGSPPDLAFGDTAADLPLLQSAKHGVAVDPDPALLRAARTSGLEVLNPRS